MRKPFIRPRNGAIAALDVGSTKVCCLIARAENNKNIELTNQLSNLRVIGIGHNAAEGIRNGAIVDMEACEVSIRRAVQSAETMSNETIESIYINLSGGSPLLSLIHI